MTITKRAFIIAALLALALSSYGAARHYAPALIQYVVEQSLRQKAPPGISAEETRARLTALLRAEPDQAARTRKLLQISARLEKAQHLTRAEWDALLSE